MFLEKKLGVLKMEKRNSFIFYDSFYNAISKIDNYKLKLEAYNMIFDYAFNKKEPESNNAIIKMIFNLVKPLIDYSDKRHIANIENGKKGGAPKGNKNALKK